jgi:glycosyltransferase involved in cell wall biosynthesis
MKLALVGPSYPHRGGIAQYTTSLYRVLERRFPVLLVSFKRLYPSLLFPGSTQMDESSRPFLVPNEAILDSIRPGSWRRAGRRLADYAPDVVVFQWWHPFFGMAYAAVLKALARSGHRPCILFLCHNVMPHECPPVPGARAVFRMLAARAFSRADGFLVHSRSLSEELEALRPGAVVREVFHPVYDLYAEVGGEALPAPVESGSGQARILFFGNIRPYKGLDILLRALAEVRRKLDFRATIAGEFYIQAEPFRKMARDLGIEGQIQWFDRYIPNEEVPRLFQSADVVVLPYTDATQSGVVPLAYQFGVPVIATSVGGLPQVIEHGVSGLLVPPGDPSALAGAIVDYFRSGRQGEFRTGVEKIKERLSWERLVDNILSLYQQIQERDSVNPASTKA